MYSLRFCPAAFLFRHKGPTTASETLVPPCLGYLQHDIMVTNTPILQLTDRRLLTTKISTIVQHDTGTTAAIANGYRTASSRTPWMAPCRTQRDRQSRTLPLTDSCTHTFNKPSEGSVGLVLPRPLHLLTWETGQRLAQGMLTSLSRHPQAPLECRHARVMARVMAESHSSGIC